MTPGGVQITINKDNKHVNGSALKNTTEKNMNLMFYAFNKPDNAVIPEETPARAFLRSQTTDRGPSRKLRSRGKFPLASSHQKHRKPRGGPSDIMGGGIDPIAEFKVS